MQKQKMGRLFVVGIGPGGPLDRTQRAAEAITASDCVVGYTRYMKLVADLTAGKELIATGMTQEAERCRLALARAREGKTVALISSGDPGIYGMAGLVLELAASERIAVPIEIVPGITAASALAARLGAPLMCDFAVLSMSDLLVPWEQIRKRLEAVAAADLVAVIYNPRSQKRTRQLAEAATIFRRHRPGRPPWASALPWDRRKNRSSCPTWTTSWSSPSRCGASSSSGTAPQSGSPSGWLRLGVRV